MSELSSVLSSERWEKDDIIDNFIIYTIRYVRIKYEDLMKDPPNTLKMLYEFSGIEITEEVYSYLHKLTHGTR